MHHQGYPPWLSRAASVAGCWPHGSPGVRRSRGCWWSSNRHVRPPLPLGRPTAWPPGGGPDLVPPAAGLPPHPRGRPDRHHRWCSGRSPPAGRPAKRSLPLRCPAASGEAQPGSVPGPRSCGPRTTVSAVPWPAQAAARGRNQAAGPGRRVGGTGAGWGCPRGGGIALESLRAGLVQGRVVIEQPLRPAHPSQGALQPPGGNFSSKSRFVKAMICPV